MKELDTLKTTSMLVSQMKTLALVKRMAVKFVCNIIQLPKLTLLEAQTRRMDIFRQSMRMTRSSYKKQFMAHFKILGFEACF
jgi:hypothetical protein